MLMVTDSDDDDIAEGYIDGKRDLGKVLAKCLVGSSSLVFMLSQIQPCALYWHDFNHCWIQYGNYFHKWRNAYSKPEHYPAHANNRQ